MSGRADFGFVSKYKNGVTVPTGQTEFQFKTAGLNFDSASYQWLVIAGTRAQYKGSGTINGHGDYGFLLTAGWWSQWRRWRCRQAQDQDLGPQHRLGGL